MQSLTEMINILRQNLYNPVCLCCGSFFVENHLFCKSCYFKKMSPRLELKKKIITKTESAYSIFDWQPGESDLLSEMVYRLKSNRCRLAWKHYATLATQALSYELDLQKINFIIPVPGSKKSSVHALIFSEIVGEIIKKPVLNILEKSNKLYDQQPQKFKTKHQRACAQFSICEQFTHKLDHLNIKERNILMVDDIMTTGSSYRQSLHALGGPRSSLLLTLFYRIAL